MEAESGEYIQGIEKVYQIVATDTSLTKSLRDKKLAALREIAKRTSDLANGRYYDPLLLKGYVEKKCRFILDARSCGEINEIISQPKPKYNGNQFQDRRYQVDEEELIGWSEASLRVPPNAVVLKRMMELMCRVFPKERLKALKQFTDKNL